MKKHLNGSLNTHSTQNQIDKIKLKYKKDINKIFETSKKNKFSGTKLEKIKLYA